MNDLKKSDMWKIQLTIAISCISSKDIDTKRVMHSKYDNIEFMANKKTDEGTEKLVQSILSRYEIGLETSMRDSDFIFDCVHLLYYKCHNINFKQGGSYTDSLD